MEERQVRFHEPIRPAKSKPCCPGDQTMGDLVELRLTKKAIYRAARREVVRMYQMSGGGVDPIASTESRELFEMGMVDEVEWLSWETYCAGILNRIEGEPPD
jgi:hypothetical protein